MRSRKTNGAVPVEIHAAIDRAMTRVVALMMAYITNAVEPTRADDPNNIAGAVKAVEDALVRIEASIAPPVEVTSPPVLGFDFASKLSGWLRGYGFHVPDSIIRTILCYPEMDAVRLLPTSMQPVEDLAKQLTDERNANTERLVRLADYASENDFLRSEVIRLAVEWRGVYDRGGSEAFLICSDRLTQLKWSK